MTKKPKLFYLDLAIFEKMIKISYNTSIPKEIY